MKIKQQAMSDRSKFLYWISTTLVNDEFSSDEELIEHFQKEGKMSKQEADFYVGQRDRALANQLSFEVQDYGN